MNGHQRVEFTSPVYNMAKSMVKQGDGTEVERDTSEVVSAKSTGIFGWLHVVDGIPQPDILDDTGKPLVPPSSEYRLCNGGLFETPGFAAVKGA
jgi:hypothetical protein